MSPITLSILLMLIAVTTGQDAICSGTPDDITIDKKLKVYSGKFVFEAESKLFNDLPELLKKRQNKIAKHLVDSDMKSVPIGAVSLLQSGQPTYYVNFTLNGWFKCDANENGLEGCTSFSSENEDVYEVTSAMIYEKKQFVSYVTQSGSEYQRWGSKIVSGAEFVIFFGHLVTIQVVNLKRDLPIVFRSDLDYQMAKTWLKCRTDLCFDSRVDYAFISNGKYMVIGRGRFNWKLPLDPWSQPGLKYEAAFSYQDIVDIGTELIYIGDQFVHRTGGVHEFNTTLQVVFNRTKFHDIDSAFRYPNVEDKVILILTSGSELEVYEPDHQHNNFKLTDASIVSSLIYKSSKAGFDAGVLSRDNTLYLFKNNFYYTYNAINESLSGPKLIQGNLFSCSPNFYANSKASQQLNITNLVELRNYRKQFAPPSYKNTKHKNTPKPKRKNRRSLRILIFTVVLLVLSSVLLGVEIRLLSRRLLLVEKRSYGSSNNAEEAPSVNSDDVLPTIMANSVSSAE
ncbi:hypothetical protein HDE_13048 [Halotydeus destructor]|nr:hypothetical protein HDE_13048 [Halotydeus destructor]